MILNNNQFHLYKNGIDPLSVSDLAENGNFKSAGESFIGKINPFSYDANLIKIAKGCAVDLYNGENWLQFANREEIDFDPVESLDAGDALAVGTDYFIYLCFDGSSPTLVVSPNSTFPSGFTALNSRKIGGFHYGHIRKVVQEGDLWVPIDSNGVKFGASGTKWQDNVTTGIVPNSVWDLKNRPRVLFGGMIKVGGLWVSIYQASVKDGTAITFMSGTNGLHVASGGLQSKYGKLPVTGTEGLNAYNFIELARQSGMRLPDYDEWLSVAFGSPQGEDGSNNYGWTKTTNTARTYTGCQVNSGNGNFDVGAGVKAFALSAYNAVDCAGNVWEWLADTYQRDTGTWAYQNVLGAGMGQVYAPNANNPGRAIAGGHWHNGVYCGPRALGLTDYSWYVNTGIGARLACDAA
jgi:formylglycine-generating enzyme required for sulfatase activity